MDWLNYHHLLYFWTTAKTGSIARASGELLLAPPTISAQISRLEEDLGEKLFERVGRRLVLTGGERGLNLADAFLDRDQRQIGPGAIGRQAR